MTKKPDKISLDLRQRAEEKFIALIPIIAMTAHAFSEDCERFIAVGINGHVSKPIDLEYLYSQIEELCGKAI